MRICSLLPAATEMLFALGLGDSLVGVSHECDYPPEARKLPALIQPRIDPSAPPQEIDRQVRELVKRGESLYAVDVERLRELAPDIIVTQELCHVCAASPEELGAALSRLSRQPRIVSLAPQRLDDVWRNIRELGAIAGHNEQAELLVSGLKSRLRAVEQAVHGAARPRALALEWLDPPYVGGHWVPEMVEIAGATPVLGQAGVPAAPLDWKPVLASDPEVIVLMPCGFDLERTLGEYRRARLPREWFGLRAVKAGRVLAVNGNSYFARSGPRLVEGVEILARIFHPELCAAPLGAAAEAFAAA